jgi:hypothetical protein
LLDDEDEDDENNDLEESVEGDGRTSGVVSVLIGSILVC